jgi:hypothetical protein
MPVINYMINRLDVYPMEKQKKHRKEHNKIHFTTEPIPNKQSLKTKLNKDNTTHQHNQKRKQSKCATLTYIGKEIRKLANKK